MSGLTAGSAALIAGAGALAGAINAAAGGGTMVSYPALLVAGYSPLTANVTNTVGLLTGYAGGSAAYRRELSGQGARVRVLGAAAAIGGAGGAVLLTRTPPGAFAAVVPWMILISCALLAAQPLVARTLQGRGSNTGHARLVIAAQLGAGVYGGFFGGALGVLTLAILGLGIADSLQRLNALKGVLSFVVNAVAALCFVFLGPVAWTAAAVMVPAALLGGVAGGLLARRLDAAVLRYVVVAFGVAVALRLLV